MDIKKMAEKTKKHVMKADSTKHSTKCDMNPKKQRLAIGGVAKERLDYPHTKKSKH